MSIIKKTIMYFIGQLGSKVVLVIIIPIYAFYLSTSQVGIYDFQLSLAQFLSPLLYVAIWEGVLRFGLPADNYKKKEVISTSLFFVSSITIVSLVVVPLIYIYIYRHSLIMSIFGVSFILTSLVTYMQYLARSLEKTQVYVKQGIYSGLVNLASIVILVMGFKLEMIGLLISYIFSMLFSIIYISLKCNVTSFFKLSLFSKFELKEMLRYSLPLVFNLVFLWFLQGFSRWYLVTFKSSTESGLFSFAFKFSAIVSTMGSVLSLSLIEDAVLTKFSDDFLIRFKNNMDSVFKFLILVVVLLIPAIGLFYSTLGKNDFAASWNICILLLVGTIFQIMSTNIGNMLNVYNKTNYVFISSLMSSLINILSCIVFGEFFGLFGVSFAYSFSCFSIFLFRYFMTRRINYWKLDYVAFVFPSMILIINTVLNVNLNKFILFINFIISLFIFAFMYRKEVWVIFDRIFNVLKIRKK